MTVARKLFHTGRSFDWNNPSMNYLLCRTENREQANTSLTELHLSDEMVALLKSGRINNAYCAKLPPTSPTVRVRRRLPSPKN